MFSPHFLIQLSTGTLQVHFPPTAHITFLISPLLAARVLVCACCCHLPPFKHSRREAAVLRFSRSLNCRSFGELWTNIVADNDESKAIDTIPRQDVWKHKTYMESFAWNWPLRHLKLCICESREDVKSLEMKFLVEVVSSLGVLNYIYFNWTTFIFRIVAPSVPALLSVFSPYASCLHGFVLFSTLLASPFSNYTPILHLSVCVQTLRRLSAFPSGFGFVALFTTCFFFYI